MRVKDLKDFAHFADVIYRYWIVDNHTGQDLDCAPDLEQAHAVAEFLRSQGGVAVHIEQEPTGKHHPRKTH